MDPDFTINHDKKTMEIRIIYLTENNINKIKQALESFTKPYTILINIEIREFGDTLKSICELIDRRSPIHLKITDILLNVQNLNAIGDVLRKGSISKLSLVGDLDSPQSSAVITLNTVNYLSKIQGSVETREALRSVEKLKLA